MVIKRTLFRLEVPPQVFELFDQFGTATTEEEQGTTTTNHAGAGLDFNKQQITVSHNKLQVVWTVRKEENSGLRPQPTPTRSIRYHRNNGMLTIGIERGGEMGILKRLLVIIGSASTS